MCQIGVELDLGIDGKGFLEVQLLDGEIVFMCDGKLNCSVDGQIVMMDGYLFVDGIIIFEDVSCIFISCDGQVMVYFDNQENGQVIGVILLVSFVNEKGLEVFGDNLFCLIEVFGDVNW